MVSDWVLDTRTHIHNESSFFGHTKSHFGESCRDIGREGIVSSPISGGDDDDDNEGGVSNMLCIELDVNFFFTTPRFALLSFRSLWSL